MPDRETHWLERYQVSVSRFVGVVVGLLWLLPFVSGMWQRAATTPYAAGGAYLVTWVMFDFFIAVAITRAERRPAAPPPPPTRAPLPHAIARIRAR